VGGNFNTIGTSSPITRNHLAAINTSDGSVVTGFDPNVNNEIFDMKLSSDGNLLYIGGAFNTVNGSTTRNFVAAVNTTSGLVNSFDPSPDDWVYSLDISSDQNILYIGGLFSIVGVSSPVTRNRIAAVNASDGSVVTGFDPNANNAVYTIGLSSNTLYIGGDFTTIGSTTRNRIAAVNATDGSLVTTFDPNVNQYVYSSGFSSNRLYIGGNFTTVGGVSPSYFASFSVPQSPSYGGSSSYVSPFVSTSSAPDTSLSTSTPVPTATDIETIPVGTSTITDTSVPTLTAYQFTFSQVLKLGSMGEEVRQLQVFLNTHGFPVAQTGNGSLGKESIYFGIKTHRALIKFQEAYKEEILIPQGLTQGTGIFLNYSKRVANAILLGQKR
jgi:hypothetical protein